MLLFRTLIFEAIELLCGNNCRSYTFFVRGFGYALFIFKEEFEMKLKKALPIIIIALSLIMALSACGGKDTVQPVDTNGITNDSGSDATSIPKEESLKYELNEDRLGYTVVGIGSWKKAEVEISEYKNLPVTAIADGAFKDCAGLEKITISDSVTSIGDFAFEGCTKLTAMDIPDSVIHIGENAFKNT